MSVGASHALRRRSARVTARRRIGMAAREHRGGKVSHMPARMPCPRPWLVRQTAGGSGRAVRLDCLQGASRVTRGNAP